MKTEPSRYDPVLEWDERQWWAQGLGCVAVEDHPCDAGDHQLHCRCCTPGVVETFCMTCGKEVVTTPRYTFQYQPGPTPWDVALALDEAEALNQALECLPPGFSMWGRAPY